jgi:hypothetical protein
LFIFKLTKELNSVHAWEIATMQPLPSLASAATRFKKSRLFSLLKAAQDTVMGPLDRLARAADVGDVLAARDRAPDPDRGLAPPTALKSQPLVWLLHMHWRATAPKRRVFRLFESLNHLS